MSLGRILVVDDTPIAREPLARVLRHEGYAVDCARNGFEALAVLEGAPAKPTSKSSGKKGAKPVADDAPPAPAWTGTIVSDETAYIVRATEKQGKSGLYWTLSFERTEKPADEVEWVDADDTAE